MLRLQPSFRESVEASHPQLSMINVHHCIQPIGQRQCIQDRIMQDIMTYAMVWIALSLGLGIAIASYLTISTVVLWIAAVSAFSFVLMMRIAPRRVRMAGLLVAVCMIGMYRESSVPQFPDWLLRRAPGLREVSGTVVSYPDVGEASISFTLAPDDLPGYLVVHWPCHSPLGAVHYGDRAVVRGRTQLPTAFEGFDYPAYLARQNIFASLFADEVGCLDQASRSLWHWGDCLRQRLLQRLRDALPPRLAGMAQSLMLGDRSALAVDIEEAFSRTGLMHLLAVSGLHLGVFLGGAWWGLRRMGLRPRLAYPLVGMLVLLALTVVGPRVSLVRAGWLFAFLALGSVLADCGVILRRWIHPINGLAAAAIAILIIRPGALFDSGFQLTMAATGSILFAFLPSGWGTQCSQALKNSKMWRGYQWVLRLLIVSVAAQAGAAPAIAWHFQAFHPLSILSNLVAVPLAALSLWAGLLSVLISATPLFTKMIVPFALLLRGLQGIVLWLAHVPFVEWSVKPMLGIWLAGCVGFAYLAHYSISLSSRTSNSTSIAPGSSDD